MLDQNITTILSTLLGGILTVVGGFLASYYIQAISIKGEKRREKKTRIEQLYMLTNDIKQTYYRLEFDYVPDKDKASELLRVGKVEKDMDMLVTLYLPELAEEFTEYLNGMATLLAAFEGIKDSVLVRIGVSDDRADIIEIHNNGIQKDVENASQKFQNALAKSLEKLCYS